MTILIYKKKKIKSKLEKLGFKLKQKEQSNIISRVYNQIWAKWYAKFEKINKTKSAYIF